MENILIVLLGSLIGSTIGVLIGEGIIRTFDVKTIKEGLAVFVIFVIIIVVFLLNK